MLTIFGATVFFSFVFLLVLGICVGGFQDYEKNGTTTINISSLLLVSPDEQEKERFIIGISTKQNSKYVFSFTKYNGVKGIKEIWLSKGVEIIEEDNCEQPRIEYDEGIVVFSRWVIPFGSWKREAFSGYRVYVPKGTIIKSID